MLKFEIYMYSLDFLNKLTFIKNNQPAELLSFLTYGHTTSQTFWVGCAVELYKRMYRASKNVKA